MNCRVVADLLDDDADFPNSEYVPAEEVSDRGLLSAIIPIGRYMLSNCVGTTRFSACTASLLKYYIYD